MSTRHANRRLLWFVVAASALHLPLLLIPLTGPEPPAERTVRVTLAPTPAPLPPPEPIAPPSDSTPEPVATTPDATPAATPPIADVEPDDVADAEPQPTAPSVAILRRQTLAAARSLAADSAPSEPADEIARTFVPFAPGSLPALPSDPGDGEIGGYMALDEEIVEQFRDVNGYDRVEVTLRNGKKMCGERRRNDFMPDPFLDDSNIFTWWECRKSFTDRRTLHAGWLD